MSEKRNVREPGRRDFLKMGGAATAALLTPSAFAVTPNKSLPALPSNPVTMKAMPTRNLGKTGYKVGIFSLGGQAALENYRTERTGFPSSAAAPMPSPPRTVPEPAAAFTTVPSFIRAPWA